MPTTPPYDAREIANFLIECAEARQRSLSLIVLMKVTYFAHGHHLAEFGEPLVSQDFEAWEHGPVIRALWDAFKDCSASIPSDFRATRFCPLTGTYSKLDECLPAETQAFLKFIFDQYAQYRSRRLIELTHEQHSPWDRIWNGTSVNLGMKIDNHVIRA